MKNRTSIALFTVITSLSFSANTLLAQDLASVHKQYPDEKEVLLNRTLEYTIDVKDGQPNIESHEVKQIAYLLNTATTYSGSYGFSHSDFHQLLSYDAYTLTPANKKLKVTDFKTSTDKESFVFYDDVKYTSFNFPAVEAGAIGNLEVSWHDKEPHMLEPFYFTEYIPVINNQLKITVSKDISIKYLLMGLDTDKIKVNIESKHHNNIYTFEYNNSPADKRYPNEPSFAWYSPHVIFYIENYKNDKGDVVSYLANTNDLYKFNHGFVKSVNTTVNPELKHIVDSLTHNLTSAESKAREIYAWVQHNIKYVAYEDGMGGFVPRDAGLVCSRRFGDCKDMASILTEMNNVAGIPAYFTWLGTRDLPYTFSQLPLPSDCNHMICTIDLDGKYVFLDGTDPTCVFGTTPAGIQDKEVMVGIDDNNYKILKIPVVDKDKNQVADSTWLELTPTGLKGRIKKTLTGYWATSFYGEQMYWDKKDVKQYMKDFFERGSNKFTVDTFKIDKKTVTNDISVTCDFSLPDYAKKIGTDYYLNLNLVKHLESSHIEYPERKTPIEFEFQFEKKYVTLLKIPDGYNVSYLPQGKSYSNKLWGFDMQYERKGNWIVLTQKFDNQTLMLTADKFQDWNKVLDTLLPLYKETLSLEKNK